MFFALSLKNLGIDAAKFTLGDKLWVPRAHPKV